MYVREESLDVSYASKTRPTQDTHIQAEAAPEAEEETRLWIIMCNVSSIKRTHKKKIENNVYTFESHITQRILLSNLINVYDATYLEIHSFSILQENQRCLITRCKNLFFQYHLLAE